MTEQERTHKAAMQAVLDQAAKTIDEMAQSNYKRDIRGELALRGWQRVSKMLRELTSHA